MSVDFRAKLAVSARDDEPSLQGRPRVLVVDDDATLRSAYRRVLARSFEPVLASSGEEALALLARGERFDVLLIDLLMPGMDGLELHRAIIDRAPELDSRIIFVTGGETTLRAQRFMNDHCNARIYKPFEPSELCELIASVAAQ